MERHGMKYFFSWFLFLSATLLVLAQAKPAERKAALLKLFVDEFVAITPGKGDFPASFEMGSDATPEEKPIHKVTFKYSFHMAKYEVTQELYEAVVGSNPSKFKGPRNGLDYVSWNEALEFCKKATADLRKEKLLGEDEVVRLPSEAEWEYCCRAGTKTSWSCGEDLKTLGEHAWYNANSKGFDPPVGKKKGNPWGLFDMHGYVREWCQDSYVEGYENAPTDGTARELASARERVLRGGSYATPPERCRSAYRDHAAPDLRRDDLAFRCVKAKK
jgi:formylglycine-generating enzyme required for sulfatase activity